MRKKYFFRMWCKPGYESEYKRRHQAVNESLLALMTQFGISNYSIYMSGTEVFNYFESEYEGDLFAALSNEAAHQEWSQYMKGIMVMEDGDLKTEIIDQTVFHFQ